LHKSSFHIQHRVGVHPDPDPVNFNSLHSVVVRKQIKVQDASLVKIPPSMKLKELESLMQDIAPFANPKVDLEQYPTGPHLASRLLFTVANSFDEFQGQTVVDLGCGTAMLTIGAAILGAVHIIGVDIDQDALEIAQLNVDEFEDPLPIDFIQSDVTHLLRHHHLSADTVIMNPPFGTRKKGADAEFLTTAFQIARKSVYSLHKSSTREYIEKFAKRGLASKRGSCQVLAQLRYDLPASYKFHKQKSRDIEVDLWRFEMGGSDDDDDDRGGEV
jgi:rRNA N6-adenosine-methyltransferase METTL5